MVRFDVPEKFVNILEELGANVWSSRIIRALKWATENPEMAREVVERYSRLRFIGRKRFKECICHGCDPDKAIELAEQRQMEASRERSLLSKVLAASRKGGYALKMPNGVWCTIKCRNGDYELTFNPGGAEVTILRSGSRDMNWTLKCLVEDGHVAPHGIGAVIYKGKAYPPRSRQATMIIRAIEENVAPEVVAALDL